MTEITTKLSEKQTYKKICFLESKIWAKIRLNIKTIPTTVVNPCASKRDQKGVKDIKIYLNIHTQSPVIIFAFFSFLFLLYV